MDVARLPEVEGGGVASAVAVREGRAPGPAHYAPPVLRVGELNIYAERDPIVSLVDFLKRDQMCMFEMMIDICGVERNGKTGCNALAEVIILFYLVSIFDIQYQYANQNGSV